MNKILFLLMILFLFIAACEYEPPTAVWIDDQTGNANPVITGIEPDEFALAGYSEVTITGQNFSPVLSENMVFFGSDQAEVLSAQPNQLVVKVPNVVSDSLSVNVVVQKAFEKAIFSPYRLESILSEWGGFGDLDQVLSIAMNGDEELYAFLKSGYQIVRTDIDENRVELISLPFPRVPDMKVGPGGDLYIQKYFNKEIYTMPPTGGSADIFATGTRVGEFFDFDQNGNIYVGGRRTGLSAILPDASVVEDSAFIAYDVKSVRVYEGYVYVLADYRGSDSNIPKKGLWRCQIIDANGTLGDEELVLSWDNAGDFSGSTYLAVTFSADGDAYILTDHENPIAIMSSTGSLDTLYPGLIPGEYSHMTWGNGNYLYLNRTSREPSERRVIRVNIAKPGAPYWGRQ